MKRARVGHGIVVVMLVGGLLGILGAPTAGAQSEDSGSVLDALRAGQPTVELRYRFEQVYDDAVGQEDALASTLRAVLGYQSGAWNGFRFRIEGENVLSVGDDLYNNAGFGDSANGVRDRPVVADPEGADLHRGTLSWENDRVSIAVGRDELNLGDQRFVGSVGWRQHHQTYDGARIKISASERLQLFYSYLESVQKVNRGVDELDGHLFEGQLEFDSGRLTFYGQLLDYDDPARSKLSSSTLGAEWSGTHHCAHGSLLYELEYARQRDAGNNPGRIDADYRLATVAWQGARLSVRGAQETLAGSARDGQFNTPLATLHKFNGWADKFLVTPTAGLVDAYLELGWKQGRASWLASYHDFEAATGSASYGTEIDGQLLVQASRDFTVGLKLANYEADQFSADTRKVSFWVSYSL